LNFRDRFLKNTQYQISWRPTYWEPNCSMRTDTWTDGRTDRQTWRS